MAKTCVIVGGPNGAGKSTFVKSFLKEVPFEYVCADVIAAELSPEHPEDAAVEAGRRVLLRCDELVEAGSPFILESTLSGRTTRAFLAKCRQAGYHVTINFIFLDIPQQSVERVKARVAKGGHHVPTEDVLRRFGRSISNFWNIYRLVADEWNLVYNAERRFQVVAVGAFEQFKVKDEAAFRRFEELLANAS